MKLHIIEDTCSIPAKTTDTGRDKNGIYYFGKKPEPPISWRDVVEKKGKKDMKVVKESFGSIDGNNYIEFDSKRVPDSDGWLTDYTMYAVIDGRRSAEWVDYLSRKNARGIPNELISHFVFVFGDKDLYNPNEDAVDFDYECESKAEAYEWFDDYTGFEEEDDDEYF